MLDVENNKGTKLQNAKTLFAPKKEKPLEIDIDKEEDQNRNFEERYGEIFKKMDEVAKKNNKKHKNRKYFAAKPIIQSTRNKKPRASSQMQMTPKSSRSMFAQEFEQKKKEQLEPKKFSPEKVFIFDDFFQTNKQSMEARSDMDLPLKSTNSDLDEAYSMNMNIKSQSNCANKNY